MFFQLVDGHAHHTRHGSHRHDGIGAFHDEDRPDQITNTQHVFRNQLARERIIAIAPHANGGEGAKRGRSGAKTQFLRHPATIRVHACATFSA